MFQAKSYVGYKLCWPDDLVINSLWAWGGGLGVSKYHGIVSTAYSVYRSRPSARIVPRFLHELVRSSPFNWELTVRSKGIWISRLQLTDTAFLDGPIPLPPPDEQAAIVRFLEHANRKIDKFIQAKRKLIGLLNEQKQAIIHRAVTRGLGPDVPLKPSGLPFIGDVPQGWEVVRFKTKVRFQEGPGIMAADFRESGVPLLRISCLAAEEATLDGCNYLDPAKVRQKWSHFAVEEGDYLLSASGSTGAVRRAGPTVKGAIPYTGIIRLWQKSPRINMEYLRFFMSSRPFADQISIAKSGVGIEHFGPTHLKRMWICLPPQEEQAQIVAAAVNETKPLNTATARTERQMSLMQEYRTRLTADVVSGKLDVREAAVRLPDLSEESSNDVKDLSHTERVDEEERDEIAQREDAFA